MALLLALNELSSSLPMEDCVRDYLKQNTQLFCQGEGWSLPERWPILNQDMFGARYNGTIYNASVWEAEAGGAGVQSQLHSESLSQKWKRIYKSKVPQGDKNQKNKQIP